MIKHDLSVSVSGLIQEFQNAVPSDSDFVISDWGWANINEASTLDHYKLWLNEGRHGEMKYLEKHFEIKEAPQKRYLKAKTALVFRIPYYPTESNLPELPKELRVALYARLADYHLGIQTFLRPLVTKLQTLYPTETFWFATDSSPVLERDLAYRAGLGWFGKNTCLIDPKEGSLFFIAEIITSLDLEMATPEKTIQPDRCGTCTRCIDACPTQALSKNGISLDARKCISYLNIEKRGELSGPEMDLIGDWLWGCDICQLVCPWNEKKHGKTEMQSLRSPKSPALTQVEFELKAILESRNEDLRQRFKLTALSRAKPNDLKRNAIIVATFYRLESLRPIIASFIGTNLDRTASWSLERLPGSNGFHSS